VLGEPNGDGFPEISEIEKINGGPYRDDEFIRMQDEEKPIEARRGPVVIYPFQAEREFVVNKVIDEMIEVYCGSGEECDDCISCGSEIRPGQRRYQARCSYMVRYPQWSTLRPVVTY
jgi:hypothetical protein